MQSNMYSPFTVFSYSHKSKTCNCSLVWLCGTLHGTEPSLTKFQVKMSAVNSSLVIKNIDLERNSEAVL